MKKLLISIFTIVTMFQAHAFERTTPVVCKPIVDIDFTLNRLQYSIDRLPNQLAKKALEEFISEGLRFKKELEELPSLRYMSVVNYLVNEKKLKLMAPNILASGLAFESIQISQLHHQKDLISRNYEKAVLRATNNLMKCSNIDSCKEQIRSLFSYWLLSDLINDKAEAYDCNFKIDIDTTFAYLKSLVDELDLNKSIAKEALNKVRDQYINLMKNSLEISPWEFFATSYEYVNKIKLSLLSQDLRSKITTSDQLKEPQYRDLILKNHEDATLEAIDALRTCSNVNRCEKLLRSIFDYWLFADFIRE